MSEFLIDERRAEVALFESLATTIKNSSSKKIWLLGVTTKLDVWKPKEAEVVVHYTTGAYKASIDAIADQFGARFHYAHLPVSLLISNYSNPDGTPIQKNVAGFDQRSQVESVRQLFEQIRRLVDWSAQP